MLLLVVEKLTEKTAKAVVRSKILLDGGTPRVKSDEVRCVFCNSKIVPKHLDDKWIFSCSCEKAIDFASTREQLIANITDIQVRLESLDKEALIAGLATYKSLILDEAKLRDEVLKANDNLLLNLKDLEIE
jgi:hypothetical protein